MIVVTTPTGGIGRRLVSILLDRAAEDVRVVVRDPAKLPDGVRERVEVVVGSHGDPAVVDKAFSGADAVFWVVPPDSAATSVDAAYSGFTRPAALLLAQHQVGHVVGVSALGRGTAVEGHAGLVTASLAMDDLIAGTGVAYRALANPSFMDNVLDDLDSLRTEGVFTDSLAADRKLPRVAIQDIAAVAAELLLDRSWTGTDSVPLLGPEDLSPDDLARILSEVLGREIRYRRQPLDELAAELTGFGLSPAFVQGIVDMKRAKDNGLDDGVPRTYQNSTPTTFRQWCDTVLKPALNQE